MAALEVVVWVSLFAVASTYLLYPLVLRCVASFHTRAMQTTNVELPRVTLFVSAFNEAAVIREKVQTALIWITRRTDSK